jgi:DnaK suppressor protein
VLEANKNLSTELAKIKEQLLERKYELERELAKLSQERFSDDQVQDPGDQALSATMETVRTSFQDTLFEEYRRIGRALEMINEGTYGICNDCGQTIAPKRLKSFPNATRCLACQESYEEGLIEEQ